MRSLSTLNYKVIAYLETGAGKTFIAVLLLKHRLSAPPNTHAPDARAVLLAPQVPLVLQHAEVLSLHLPFPVGRYVGEMGVDLWDRWTWVKEWDQHRVLVMTPQILLNLLSHAIIPVGTVKEAWVGGVDDDRLIVIAWWDRKRGGWGVVRALNANICHMLTSSGTFGSRMPDTPCLGPDPLSLHCLTTLQRRWTGYTRSSLTSATTPRKIIPIT